MFEGIPGNGKIVCIKELKRSFYFHFGFFWEFSHFLTVRDKHLKALNKRC